MMQDSASEDEEDVDSEGSGDEAETPVKHQMPDRLKKKTRKDKAKSVSFVDRNP